MTLMEMTAATPSLADRHTIPLAGMRAAVAAEAAARKGVTAALAAAILGLLDAILALLMDLKAAAAQPACVEQAAAREARPVAPAGQRGDDGATGGAPAAARGAESRPQAAARAGTHSQEDPLHRRAQANGKSVSPVPCAFAGAAPIGGLPALAPAAVRTTPDSGAQSGYFRKSGSGRNGVTAPI